MVRGCWHTVHCKHSSCHDESLTLIKKRSEMGRWHPSHTDGWWQSEPGIKREGERRPEPRTVQNKNRSALKKIKFKRSALMNQIKTGWFQWMNLIFSPQHGLQITPPTQPLYVSGSPRMDFSSQSHENKNRMSQHHFSLFFKIHLRVKVNFSSFFKFYVFCARQENKTQQRACIRSNGIQTGIRVCCLTCAHSSTVICWFIE